MEGESALRLDELPERYEAICHEFPDLTGCRVTLQERGSYRLMSPSGSLPARVSGRFHYEATGPLDYPAVGDYVLADLSGGDVAIIHRVLPRTSVFVRKAAGNAKVGQVVAANVDILFVCMALNADFNLRRLERYLSLGWESGATPVVLLTKADLCCDLEEKLSLVEDVSIGVDVIAVSAREDDGLKEIEPYLVAGTTLAFVGSSGVGKSTLINALLGEDRIKTGDLRGNETGRHTTTHRELIVLSGNVVVIDTPGMRELGVWDVGDGISFAFSDIEELARACRFADCTHQTEPGCAVRAALERGDLAPDRLASYLKLKAENAYFENDEAYLATKEKKFKHIAKLNKTNRKR